MGSLNEQGAYIYDESDQISPIHTLLNLGSTAAGEMVARVHEHALIMPVANQSERDAYYASEGPGTATKPLYVDRADLNTVERNNGTGWKTFASQQNSIGWTGPATWGLDYATNSTAQFRKINDVVYARGLLRPGSGVIVTGAIEAEGKTASLGVLPAGMHPQTTLRIPITRWVAGGTNPPMTAGAIFTVSESGNFYVTVPGNTTGVYLDGVAFPVT